MKTTDNLKIPEIFYRKVDETLPLAKRIDLVRLRAAVDKRPFDMESYAAFRPWSCGTVGCISGNAVLNEFPPEKQTVDTYYQCYRTIEEAAANALGLTFNETQELFFLIFPQSIPPSDPVYRTVVLAAIQGWLIAKGVPVNNAWFERPDANT